MYYVLFSRAVLFPIIFSHIVLYLIFFVHIIWYSTYFTTYEEILLEFSENVVSFLHWSAPRFFGFECGFSGLTLLAISLIFFKDIIVYSAMWEHSYLCTKAESSSTETVRSKLDFWNSLSFLVVPANWIQFNYFLR